MTKRYKTMPGQRVFRWIRYHSVEMELAAFSSLAPAPRNCEGEVVYPECGSLHRCEFHEQDFFIVDWQVAP